MNIFKLLRSRYERIMSLECVSQSPDVKIIPFLSCRSEQQFTHEQKLSTKFPEHENHSTQPQKPVTGLNILKPIAYVDYS